MDAQQLAARVTQLESRVAVLEDENKIVKGEVKQILTEIRTAILSRENPFENDSPVQFSPVAPVAPLAATPPPAPAYEEPAHYAEQPLDAPAMPERGREPIPLRAHMPMTPLPQPPLQPQWSLLTIAGLSAWGEEAMRRLGALRLEILLDLCEAAGHLSPEARAALSRITQLDAESPVDAPSTNETVVILRQLDALIADEEELPAARVARL